MNEQGTGTATESLLHLRWAPHMRTRETTAGIMLAVLVSLVPAAAGSVWFFGRHALALIAVCMGSCIATEAAVRGILRRRIRILDGSAAVTGLLLAFCLPPGLPLWMGALGGFLSIFLVKELFGGIGFNIFNPALAGRAILLASFPVDMTRYVAPFSGGADAVSCATPLIIAKERMAVALPAYRDMFIGSIPGSLGETSALLLGIGAAFLLLRGIITWHIPLSYAGTVVFLAAATGQDPLFHLLAGGLVLGAFFMATDYVTSPLTGRGKIVFGAGCGVLTFVIRMKGGYPEGVCYSILIMNMLVPLIDRYVVPRRFGVRRTGRVPSGSKTGGGAR